MSDMILEAGTLADDSGPVLVGLPPNVAAETDDRTGGVFLSFTPEKPGARHVFPLGDLTGIARWTACHRYEPFWMTAKAGTRGGEVPVETQYLLCERSDGTCLLLVPLVREPFRCSLEGSGENGLSLVAETGDDATVAEPGGEGRESVLGLFVASGEEPYELLGEAAQSVAETLQAGRLRRDKPLPRFVDQFGWCTWDAFYKDVSHDRVKEGLESFRAGGVEPRYLILDDGWQSVRPFPTGEKRLTSFAANEKFPRDLAPTVRMAKDEYGVETFLVWHAVGGYWGGVDGAALPGYGVRSVSRRYSPGINHHVPTLREWFGTACGVVPPEHVHRFYQDYHRHLRLQGVDGVKVDNQASLEGVAQGSSGGAGAGGGRVGLMRAYREALEGAAHVHFGGSLINCMSCANEMLYGALASTLTRTSTDFWPKKPETHGLHLYVNAQVSAWFGEWVHPDWDMFQSGHERGAYHAAGRAVGGCPVYVSDKPGAHDFDLLRKLVLPDGSVLRALLPGRPTRDCLFHDPTREPVLLKIWNRNRWGLVVGAFHAMYGDGVGPISGSVRLADVPEWAREDPETEGERWAVYAHNADELRVLGPEDEWPFTLDPLTAEVFTLVPVRAGMAPVGLGDRFNASGAILDRYEEGDGEGGAVSEVQLWAGGRFTLWCETEPVLVEADDEAAEYVYDGPTGRLDVRVPEGLFAPRVRVFLGTDGDDGDGPPP